MNTEEQQLRNDLDKRLGTAADRLRSNVNPSDPMHVVLGLVFLKYISDAFKERRAQLEAAFKDPEHDYHLGPAPGELTELELQARDCFPERNVFRVSAPARWDFVTKNAKVHNGTKLQARNGKAFEYGFKSIGRLLDDALDAVEKDNPKRKNVLDKSHARWRVDAALPGLNDEFAKVAGTFDRGKRGAAVDEPGFAKAATLDDIREHEYVLTPGRYVGAAAQDEDGESFQAKMARLGATQIEFVECDLKVSRLTATKHLEALATGGFVQKVKVGRSNDHIHQALNAVLTRAEMLEGAQR